MLSPIVRAKAKDVVDALDNLTAYLDPDSREELKEFVLQTFDDIEKVLSSAAEIGGDPVEAYNAFTDKFEEYWRAPSS